jgi:hypothetical protein
MDSAECFRQHQESWKGRFRCTAEDRQEGKLFRRDGLSMLPTTTNGVFDIHDDHFAEKSRISYAPRRFQSRKYTCLSYRQHAPIQQYHRRRAELVISTKQCPVAPRWRVSQDYRPLFSCSLQPTAHAIM